MLQKQGVEISRATAPFTVTMPGKTSPARATTTDGGGGGRGGPSGRRRSSRRRARQRAQPPTPETRTFPAGSYIVRMDQPYSRIADALLDYQYWAPNDPQKNPYDDTGWTFGELFNVQVGARHRREGARRADGDGQRRRAARRAASTGTGSDVRRSTTTPTTRWSRCATASRTRTFEAAEEPFEAGGQEVQPRLVHHQERRAADARARRRPSSACKVVRGRRGADGEDASGARARASRSCTPGSSTQNEGWWRQAFDHAAGPVHLHQHAGRREGRRTCSAKYDVILFAPGGRGTAGDRQRHADVRQPAAVEEDAG